jgi:hypothetical protein
MAVYYNTNGTLFSDLLVILFTQKMAGFSRLPAAAAGELLCLPAGLVWTGIRIIPL